MKLIWKLLRQHISIGQLACFFLANLFGMVIVLLSVQFYKDIQTWKDAALEQAGFSRAEIRDGLAEVQARLQSAQMERSDNP